MNAYNYNGKYVEDIEFDTNRVNIIFSDGLVVSIFGTTELVSAIDGKMEIGCRLNLTMKVPK